MSEELHASNESLSRLWQSQAASRQARASEVIVGEACYQPPTPIEFREAEPIVEPPAPAPIDRGPAYVIDHLATPSGPSPTVIAAKPSPRAVGSPARVESNPPDRVRSSRETSRVLSQRRADERRTAVEREWHERALRTNVARHEETSREVRPENYAAIAPPPAPRPIEPVATAKPPAWDVRRPAATRPVEKPSGTSRVTWHAPRKKSHLAHSLLGGLEQQAENQGVGSEASVNVVA